MKLYIWKQFKIMSAYACMLVLIWLPATGNTWLTFSIAMTGGFFAALISGVAELIMWLGGIFLNDDNNDDYDSDEEDFLEESRNNN